MSKSSSQTRGLEISATHHCLKAPPRGYPRVRDVFFHTLDFLSALPEHLKKCSALRACHRPRFAKFSRSFREKFSKTLARKNFRKADLVDAINLVQKSSKSELSSRFFGRSKFWGAKKVEFSNGRLPPEDGSVRPQTLGKRVSDDPRHFIF